MGDANEDFEGIYVVMRQDFPAVNPSRPEAGEQKRVVVLCSTVTEVAAADAIDEYCMGCFAQRVPGFTPEVMRGRTPLDLEPEEWDQIDHPEVKRITSENFTDFGALANSGEVNRIEWGDGSATEFFWTMAGPYIKEALLDDTPGIRTVEAAYDAGKGQKPPKRGGDWISDQLRDEYLEKTKG